MLSIKLKLIGKRGQRSFRVIIQEARSKLRGKFIEDLGWYNPHSNTFEVKKDRVLHWLKVGAQPTETVAQLLKKNEISAGGEISPLEGGDQSQDRTVKTEPEEKVAL